MIVILTYLCLFLCDFGLPHANGGDKFVCRSAAIGQVSRNLKYMKLYVWISTTHKYVSKYHSEIVFRETKFVKKLTGQREW